MCALRTLLWVHSFSLKNRFGRVHYRTKHQELTKSELQQALATSPKPRTVGFLLWEAYIISMAQIIQNSEWFVVELRKW